MSHKFLNLDIHKQERILNAAMKEFATLGYEKASTNTIVKDAGISKGLLFHYFGSKKKLYIFIANYGFDLVMDKFKDSINFEESDILELHADVTVARVELMNAYPNLFDFFLSCTKEDSQELVGEIVIQGNSLRQGVYEKLFTDIDYSLFKDGIDVPKVLNIIKWTFEHYGNQYVGNLHVTMEELDKDKVLKDINDYVDIFRSFFYNSL